MPCTIGISKTHRQRHLSLIDSEFRLKIDTQTRLLHSADVSPIRADAAVQCVPRNDCLDDMWAVAHTQDLDILRNTSSEPCETLDEKTFHFPASRIMSDAN
jgi:hypothetical protein